jgi:hypothetical protein
MTYPVAANLFPHYADPGDRVWYARRVHNDPDPRLKLGYGFVEYECLALDTIAVKVRTDNGVVVNLIPEFGDRVKIVRTGDEDPDA